MNRSNQKLELTWIGKDEEIKLEPRILIEDQEKSYGDYNSENMLIHGDNLLALKALEQDFSGQIKCIYIDPPYNTGSAFEHYDDNLEHSTWLNLMKPRLEILKELLHPTEGSIWISIDDNECHYLKILCDEVFGRFNFVANVIWEKKYAPQNDAKWLSDSHDHILVYAKKKNIWRPNLLPRTVDMDERYKNYDNDPRGPWKPDNLLRKDRQESGVFTITTPSGRRCDPPAGRSWRTTRENFQKMVADHRIWFGKSGSNIPAIKRFLSEVKGGRTCMTIWKYNEVGHTQDAQREVTLFNPLEPFGTPKPERLLERILTLSSDEGDFVLDSFLGSGTTSAVAHKMKRKWIGVELGEHCFSHCLPRLKKVVNGEDQGGISSNVHWKGGGGFKFYELAPSLLRKDKYGNWIIDEKYNANMLAAAMCKHEGFKYFPDVEVYWKQGKSTETDFIFVTTGFVTVEQLDRIHEEMKPSESLLTCAKAFAPGCKERHGNITIMKIPKAVLGKCEFGKDNYDLNIINAPRDEEDETDETEES